MQKAPELQTSHIKPVDRFVNAGTFQEARGAERKGKGQGPPVRGCRFPVACFGRLAKRGANFRRHVVWRHSPTQIPRITRGHLCSDGVENGDRLCVSLTSREGARAFCGCLRLAILTDCFIFKSCSHTFVVRGLPTYQWLLESASF